MKEYNVLEASNLYMNENPIIMPKKKRAIMRSDIISDETIRKINKFLSKADHPVKFKLIDCLSGNYPEHTIIDLVRVIVRNSLKNLLDNMRSKKTPEYLFAQFKKKRKKKGLTLRQVGERTGISNAYLSQIENNKIGNPSFKVISKLKEFYSL